MPCTYCNVSFSIIKWKNKCQTCYCTFCTNCVIEKRCLACYHVLESHLQYDRLMKVKVKDLKLYSNVRDLPISTCREKTELVNMILQNCNAPIPTQQNGSSNTTPVYPRMPKNSEQSSQRSHNNFQPPNPFQNTSRMSQPELFNFPETVYQPPGYERTQEAFPTRQDFYASFTDTSHVHVPNNEAASPSQSTPRSESKPSPASKQPSNASTQPESETKEESPQPKPVPTGNGNKLLITDLTSAAQIDNLSIREMKQILVDNFVDYKGCVERSELLSRVKNLYKDRAKNDEKQTVEDDGETTVDDEDNICRICWDKQIDCVFLECGHMVTCTTCGKKMNECPICRQYVVRCVHVFRT